MTQTFQMTTLQAFKLHLPLKHKKQLFTFERPQESDLGFNNPTRFISI